MNNDLISRKAAIDAMKNRWKKTRNYEGIGDDIAEECELYLKQVPSVQPEIIRCKDCKWGAQDEDGWWYCVEIGGRMGDGEKGDGFCSDAERRTDDGE